MYMYVYTLTYTTYTNKQLTYDQRMEAGVYEEGQREISKGGEGGGGGGGGGASLRAEKGGLPIPDGELK